MVSTAFTAHAVAALPTQPDSVEVLGIDEIRRGRPWWVLEKETGTWRTAVDRWHVGFVDLSGGQGLLGQVEGRTTATAVTGWPPAIPTGAPGAVRSEGTNRVIKTIARDAYGFRNPENQRLRTRCATTRRTRRYLNPA